MNKVLQQSTFTHKTVDDQVIAGDLVLSISTKLDKYRLALHKAKSALEVLHFFDTVPRLSRDQCCDFSPLRVKPDSHFQVAINKKTFCDISPPTFYSGDDNDWSNSLSNSPRQASHGGGSADDGNGNFQTASLAANLSAVFSMNLASEPGIRWQYFVSAATGRESVYPGWGQPGRPCAPQAVQHAQVVLNTLVRKPLDLVFVIDCAMARGEESLKVRCFISFTQFCLYNSYNFCTLNDLSL